MAFDMAEGQKLVLQLCGQPEGAVEADLKAAFSGKAKQFADVINKLANAHRITSKSRADGTRVYFAVDESHAAKRKGLTPDEVLTLQEIGRAVDRGIWTKDLKKKTGLAQTTIAKALKTLEQRELVKSVKSVQHGQRKQYMLFELEPSQDVTGGVWYEGAEFDKDMVNTMYSLCLKCMEQLGQATVQQVCDFVNKTGVIQVPMQPAELDKVMQALRYDCQVEVVPGADEAVYRPARRRLPFSDFGSIPCGVCPVINKCSPDGPISPATCVYYNEWLSF